MDLQPELYRIPDRADEDLVDSLLQRYHKQVRPKGSQGEPATVNIALSLLAINSLVSYICLFVIYHEKRKNYVRLVPNINSRSMQVMTQVPDLKVDLRNKR